MKISVVTINFNNALGLKKTLESVFSQTFYGFEYIVIDGGSTDGSTELITKFSDKISVGISEYDNGIYNAMNKGIRAAKGKYILFLNSGDTFYDSNSLSNAVAEIDDEDILYGNINVLTVHSSWIKTYPSTLSFSYFLKDTLPHPASLIKRNLFDKIGLFNENNKIVSDWEFFLLAINKYNCTYKYLPLTISNFMHDGISSKAENVELIAKEKNRALSNHFPTFLNDYDQLSQLTEDNKLLQKRFDLLHNSRVVKLSRKLRKLLPFNLRYNNN